MTDEEKRISRAALHAAADRLVEEGGIPYIDDEHDFDFVYTRKGARYEICVVVSELEGGA